MICTAVMCLFVSQTSAYVVRCVEEAGQCVMDADDPR
ncbi:hypothetical protein ABIF66_008776 [Bradyrhizobium japonicum]